MTQRTWLVLSSIFCVISWTGCNGSSVSSPETFGTVSGNGNEVSVAPPAKSVPVTSGTALSVPKVAPVPTPVTVGPTCKSNDPNLLCMGLKYVAYEDPKNISTVSLNDAVTAVQGINKVWKQCNIAFQIDNYLAVAPTNVGLQYQPANTDELAGIRNKFEDNNTLLVVITGNWDRTGSLGATAANAWTSMPGDLPYGAVLEKPVGAYSNIIAHELGHYMNLLHVSDQTDLMNPIIYDNSTGITSDQCATARSAVNSYWSKMIR